MLPINKKGELLLRCKKQGGKCKPKGRIKFLQDLGLLNDILGNAEIILNPDNWEIVEIRTADHTCGDEVDAYNSDRENFGRLYCKQKMELNDHHGTMAWDMVSKIFESGNSKLKLNFKLENFKT